jgi:hypothetical protein
MGGPAMTEELNEHINQFTEVEAGDYMVEGEAIDGEAILRLRPEIEAHVAETIGIFSRTKLYWNLKEIPVPEGELPKGDRPFVYQIHFYHDDKQSDL